MTIPHDVPNDNKTDSEPFKLQSNFTNDTNAPGTSNVEIALLLKYLCNFWRTLDMPPVNYQINLILNWSANCFIVNLLDAGSF